MSKVKAEELDFIESTNKRLLNTAAKVANTVLKHNKNIPKSQVIDELKAVCVQPAQYLESPYSEFAFMLQNEIDKKANHAEHTLRAQALPYALYGSGDKIEAGALEQMNTAMQLPITQAGALMPDAHVGYGLPIGGVLATDPNTIIPYAVGVDIACRMCMSIYPLPAERIEKDAAHLEKILVENTLFGIAGTFKKPMDDALFEKSVWQETALLRSLKSKAYSQVGTSGTGNHFVEWGELQILEHTTELGLEPGRYLALLSHSGSRGFGATIANHYSQLAMQNCKLPKSAQHLAWLYLDTEAGQEYWLSMNLAGEYASTNHRQIHTRIAKAMQLEPVLKIENHHNFAWLETLADGSEVMVHRKGATPAAQGEMGIIPGSSVQPGFIVRGKGANNSLQSASHGAGRQMSRNAAFKAITPAQVRNELAKYGVKMIGGDIDEAPMVYKDIYEVMQAQADLVDILGAFHPRIIRMADPDRRKGARED